MGRDQRKDGMPVGPFRPLTTAAAPGAWRVLLLQVLVERRDVPGHPPRRVVERRLADLPPGDVPHDLRLLLQYLPLPLDVPAVLLGLEDGRHRVPGLPLLQLLSVPLLVANADAVEPVRDDQRGDRPQLESGRTPRPRALRQVDL